MNASKGYHAVRPDDWANSPFIIQCMECKKNYTKKAYIDYDHVSDHAGAQRSNNSHMWRCPKHAGKTNHAKYDKQWCTVKNLQADVYAPDDEPMDSPDETPHSISSSPATLPGPAHHQGPPPPLGTPMHPTHPPGLEPATSDQIGALNAKMDTLVEQIGGLNAKMDTLGVQIGNLKVQLTGVRQDLAQQLRIVHHNLAEKIETLSLSS